MPFLILEYRRLFRDNIFYASRWGRSTHRHPGVSILRVAVASGAALTSGAAEASDWERRRADEIQEMNLRVILNGWTSTSTRRSSYIADSTRVVRFTT